MPRPKRKQKHVLPLADTAKRRRVDRSGKSGSEPSPYVIDGDEAGDFWSIRDIIEEGKHSYKVDWADNPKTGEQYSPTWIPKRDANDAAIASWEEQKQRPKPHPKLIQPKIQEPSDDSFPVASRPRRSVRRQRILDSSSPAPGALSSNDRGLELLSQPSLSQDQFEKILEDHPELEVEKILADHPGLRVQISQHSSFPRHLYTTLQLSQPQGEGASPGTVSHAPSAQTLQSPPITISSDNFVAESPVSSNLRTSPATNSLDLPGENYSPRAFDRSRDASEVQETVISLEEYHLDLETQATPTVGLKGGVAGPFVPDSFSVTDISWSNPRTTTGQVHSAHASGKTIGRQRSEGQLEQGFPQTRVEKTSEGNATTPTSQSRNLRHSDRRQEPRPHSVPIRQSPRFQTQISLLSDPLPTQTSESYTSSRPLQDAQIEPRRGSLLSGSLLETAQDNYSSLEKSIRRSKSPVSLARASRPQALQLDPRNYPIGSSSQREPAETPVFGERGPKSLPERVSPDSRTQEVIQSVEQVEDYSQHSYPSPGELMEMSKATTSPGEMSDPYGRRTGPPVTDLHPAPAPSPIHIRNAREPIQASIPSPDSMASTMAANVEARQANLESRSPSQIPEPRRISSPPNSRLEPQPIGAAASSQALASQHTGPSGSSQALEPPPQTQADTSSAIAPPARTEHKVSVLDTPTLGKMEYVVPLALPGRIRDEYFNTIRYHSRAVRSLTKSRTPDEAAAQEVQTMLTRLDNVSTFTDLDNKTTASQAQNGSLDDECNWAVNCSSKFHFLRVLLGKVRNSAKHIVIVARSGQLQNILERFLLGHKINCGRLNDMSGTTDTPSGARQSRLFVSLATSKYEMAPMKLPPSHLIIAFDSSFDPLDPSIQDLRTRSAASSLNGSPVGSATSSNGRSLVPVIRLLVYCAAEHIRLCAPAGLSQMDQLRFTLECIMQTSSQVGDLSTEESRADAAAEEVAAFVNMGASSFGWTLPSIRPIKLDDGITFVNASQDSLKPADGGSEEGTPGPKKRAVDEMLIDSENHKRPRTTPGAEVTHISDSAPATHSTATPAANLRRALIDKETELTDRDARISKLETRAGQAEQQNTDYLAALEDLQTRFEKLARKNNRFKHDNRELQATVEQDEAERERLERTVAQLRAERDGAVPAPIAVADTIVVDALPSDLAAADAAQASSSTAELFQLRAALQSLRAENARLTRAVAARTSDFEFARMQYQNASTAAAEAAAELAALHAEQAAPAKAASAAGGAPTISDAAAKAQAASLTAQAQEARVRAERLRTENEGLKEALAGRMRGRGVGVATRAGSVGARSPRVVGGAGGRDEGEAGNGSRAGSRAPVSRAVSPAPGVPGARRGARRAVPQQ